MICEFSFGPMVPKCWSTVEGSLVTLVWGGAGLWKSQKHGGAFSQRCSGMWPKDPEV